MARNRLLAEVGKGIEALRSASVKFTNIVASNKTLVAVIGPFETDIDVEDVIITSGVLITSNAGNTLDVYNGTVSGASKITSQVRPDTTLLTAQVPKGLTVSLLRNRVLAGTPITVNLVLPGNTSTPADLTVRIAYDIPVYDPNAKIHSYGAYDDGQ